MTNDLLSMSMLKVEEVANLLAVSRNMVYKLIYEGKLGHARIGTAVRVPKVALNEYLKQHTH